MDLEPRLGIVMHIDIHHVMDGPQVEFIFVHGTCLNR
jgi:hypothetical protein